MVFFTPFYIAFHLKKKLPPNGLGFYFQWEAPKKGKKKGGELMVMIEWGWKGLGFHDLLSKSTMHGFDWTPFKLFFLDYAIKQLSFTVVRWGEWVSLVLSRPITLGNHQTRQSSIKREEEEEGWVGLDWIGGFVTWTLRWERAKGHFFNFPRWFRPQWHPFFNMPKLMSKFLKWVAKFAIRRCTSYTDSQESVYLIAPKKN